MNEHADQPEPVELELPPENHSWVVLHARPRCEKKIEEYCRQRNLHCWLPLLGREHRYGNRVRKFWKPVFPGYVFCVVDGEEKIRMEQNRYVANLLEVYEPDALLQQLRSLQLALQVGDALEVLPFIEEGKAVVVSSGPFKGVEGIIAQVKADTSRVVVNVDLVGQAVAMEVDSNFLEPAR